MNVCQVKNSWFVVLVLAMLACQASASVPPVQTWPSSTPLPTDTPTVTPTWTPVPTYPPTATLPAMAVATSGPSDLAVVRTGVANGTVNLRECGSEECAVLTVLSEGHYVRVIEPGPWAKVHAQGLDGYVNSRYLEMTR